MTTILTRALEVKLERPGWEYNCVLIAANNDVQNDYSLVQTLMTIRRTSTNRHDKQMIPEFLDYSNCCFLPDVKVTTKDVTGIFLGCPVCGNLSGGKLEVL